MGTPTNRRAPKKRRALPARYALAQQARTAVVSLIPKSHLPNDPADLLGAALQQALTTAYKNGDLQSIHPLLLEVADRKRRELRIAEETHALNLRKLEAQIHIYENREAILQKAFANSQPQNCGCSSTQLCPDHVQKIRAIYGLDNPAFQPNKNWPGWNQEEPPPLHDPLLDPHPPAELDPPLD